MAWLIFWGFLGLVFSPPLGAQGIASSSLVATNPALITSETFILSPADFASSPIFVTPDPFSTTLRILTSLILVIGLVFVLSWFLQKRIGFNRSVLGKILGILPLDGKRFIYLVDVMGKVLVLGVTEYNINVLSEITDKTTIDALRLQSNTPSVPSLEKMFPFLKRSSPSEEPEPPTDFSSRTQTNQQQKQQIEKLLLKREKPNPEDRQL